MRRVTLTRVASRLYIKQFGSKWAVPSVQSSTSIPLSCSRFYWLGAYFISCFLILCFFFPVGPSQSRFFVSIDSTLFCNPNGWIVFHEVEQNMICSDSGYLQFPVCLIIPFRRWFTYPRFISLIVNIWVAPNAFTNRPVAHCLGNLSQCLTFTLFFLK